MKLETDRKEQELATVCYWMASYRAVLTTPVSCMPVTTISEVAGYRLPMSYVDRSTRHYCAFFQNSDPTPTIVITRLMWHWFVQLGLSYCILYVSYTFGHSHRSGHFSYNGQLAIDVIGQLCNTADNYLLDELRTTLDKAIRDYCAYWNFIGHFAFGHISNTFFSSLRTWTRWI